MTGIRVRTAEMSDLEKIARIESESFSEPWSYEGFKDAFALDTARIFAAFYNDREGKSEGSPAGYLVLYFTPGDGELMTVAVEKGYRGLGIGHALIKEMKRFARENGIVTIALEVRESNAAAITLYKDEGFITAGKRRDFYSFPREDAFVMTWRDELNA
jgi:[ribosomal protein S18]-alanine N-acetyltransferase